MRSTGRRVTAAAIAVAVVVSCADAGGAGVRASWVGRYRGVNLVSWTGGDYPRQTAVRIQTHRGSRGFVKAEVVSGKAFAGKGSLEVTLDMAGRDAGRRAGEVFIDLRYPPVYNSDSPIKLVRDNGGRVLGADLSGTVVAAAVLCEEGSGGPRSAPSGLQIFLKSLSIVDGKEVWSSYYGNWHNVSRYGRRYGESSELGDIEERKWSVVSVRLPGAGILIEAPDYGYADPGFSPARVALVGIKFGLNDGNLGNVSGKRIWIDALGWKKIVGEHGRPIRFETLIREHAVELWKGLDKAPVHMVKGMTFTGEWTEEFRRIGGRVTFSFEHAGDPVRALGENGFNAAAVVNTEYMDDEHSTTIGPVKGRTHSMAEVGTLFRELKKSRVRPVLKPHVDLLNGRWRGEARPPPGSTPEERRRWLDAWFASYERFIVRWGTLAQRNNVELLVLGTELKSLVGRENRARWERVIQAVRRVYKGKLTYAANWDNYRQVCFWDLLDLAGIDAYFPLSAKRQPAREELVAAWSGAWTDGGRRNWIRELESWQRSLGKPLVFTEAGYRSVDFAAERPWEFKKERPANPRLQADCYRALLEAFEDKKWLEGVFFWHWSPKAGAGGPFDTNFTPQNKPAQRAFLDGAP